MDSRYTQRQLVSTVGSNRGAVTRAIHGLEATWAVEVAERRIHLRNQEALEREAAARNQSAQPAQGSLCSVAGEHLLVPYSSLLN